VATACLIPKSVTEAHCSEILKKRALIFFSIKSI
jgi:hypothetical protein